jgi:ribosomal protein S27E
MSPKAQILLVLCPNCGREKVASLEIRLCMRIARTGFSSPQFGRAFYALRCPGCNEYFTREADASVAELLIRAGALVFTWEPPAEILEHSDAPLIVLDDLIDLHFEMEREFA